jgi:hypothetical protein
MLSYVLVLFLMISTLSTTKSAAQAAGVIPVLHLKVTNTKACELGPEGYEYTLEVDVALNASVPTTAFLSLPFTAKGISLASNTDDLAQQRYEVHSTLDSFDGPPQYAKIILGRGHGSIHRDHIAVFVASNDRGVGHGFVSKGRHILVLSYTIGEQQENVLKESLIFSEPTWVDLPIPSHALACTH